jgi:hypothetical protein
MRIPAIKGIIDRRILANFRIAPQVMADVLPQPFRPKLVHGFGIGGICLIRLKAVRPKLLPIPWGIGSENAAHRFAVEWDEDGEAREGVYIPRRDTNSRLNTWAGGTLFPGIHHRATFSVGESADRYSVTMRSDDERAYVHVAGRIADDIPESSVFSSVADVSEFFERGSLGYSDAHRQGEYDGLELRCRNWQVQPLEIEQVESSFFQDEQRFPPGSVEFDCALLMRGIQHEWHGRGELCCAANS